MTTCTRINKDGTLEEIPFLIKRGVEYVSEHISRHEVEDPWTGKVVLFQPIIELFEEARKGLGRPIGINSGYRTPEYQEHLAEIGYKAAKNYPPHCEGAALDLAIPAALTYYPIVQALTRASRKLGYPTPRIGVKEYGYKFVHVDLVFMLFEPYNDKKNPIPDKWIPGAEW